MRLKEHITKITAQARQFAVIADQLDALQPIVRTPADRSRDPHQPPISNDIDCDIKLPSMIIAEGMSKEVADRLQEQLVQTLADLAQRYRNIAINVLKSADMPTPFVDAEKEQTA